MRIKDLSNGSLTQASSTYFAIDSSSQTVTNKISYNNLAIHLLNTFTMTLAGATRTVKGAIDFLHQKIGNLDESRMLMSAEEDSSFSIGTGDNTVLIVANSSNGKLSAAFITRIDSVYNKVDLLSDPDIIIGLSGNTSTPVSIKNNTGYSGYRYRITL